MGSDSERNSATGVVTGDASDVLYIDVGFVPNIVKLYNSDGLNVLAWNSAMAVEGTGDPDTGVGVLQITAGTMTFITINGILAVDGVGENNDTGSGVADDVIGFSIGTNADVNADGELIYWEAIR